MNENSRSLAIKNILNGKTKKEPRNIKTSEYFGDKRFIIEKKIAKQIIDKSYSDKTINLLLDDIKNWAVKNQATHYTHWFYPLRGSTAEKHDSFINLDSDKVIEKLNFNELLKQEPDASSFPSGGMRSTFESRGYSVWDPTSPLFILNDTLCIPTTFISYNGKTLDFKTPLLKSENILNKSATKICKYFDKDVKYIESTLGWEQEFFIIDRSLYLARPDLVLTERTLFGHSSAKDQQLSNNYLGSMPSRVRKFLKDVEKCSYELGIPLKTRHNEVAPHQFEIAPIYEEMNIAIDHNILMMNVLDEVSEKHKLKVLFHEKPFAGINGSGKHNNWSLQTDKGDNLLVPGKEKMRFITFLVTIVKAISKYPNLLRASIATPENEHRLGGHEAPPAIISVFLGDKLTNILDNLENIDFDNIPDTFIDNTDRNRTSPFAFTGNKFEFRAPGSSINCAKPMTILNMIVADQLQKLDAEVRSKKEIINVELKGSFKEKRKQIDKSFKELENGSFEILKDILVRYIEESKYIRFEGDGYSDEWIKEAEKRGLKNIQLTPEVQKFYLENDIIELYERNGILTKEEILSRYEIKLEKYIKKIQIEGRVLGDLARNHIIPAAIKYQNILLENHKNGMSGSRTPTYVISNIKQLDLRIDGLNKYIIDMTEERKIANNMENLVDMAEHYSTKVFPFFEKIRYEADELELIVDDSLWTLPKYRELLFLM